MPRLKIEGNVNLYYEDIGSGPPVIFVHGFSGAHSLWESQVEDLSPQFRCITLDLRGHGWSDKPNEGYTIAQNARDVRALLNALRLERPSYVGFSLGAAIGLGLIDIYGNIFDRMVFVGGTPCWGRQPDFEHGHPQDLISQWIEEIKANRPKWAYEAVRKMFYREPDPAVRMWIWNQSMLLPLRAAIQTIDDSRRVDLRAALPKIAVPAAIFHGRHDEMDYFEAGEYMARTIKGASLAPFENSGHACFLEEPIQFNNELRSFLLRSR